MIAKNRERDDGDGARADAIYLLPGDDFVSVLLRIKLEKKTPMFTINSTLNGLDHPFTFIGWVS